MNYYWHVNHYHHLVSLIHELLLTRESLPPFSQLDTWITTTDTWITATIYSAWYMNYYYWHVNHCHHLFSLIHELLLLTRESLPPFIQPDTWITTTDTWITTTSTISRWAKLTLFHKIFFINHVMSTYDLLSGFNGWDRRWSDQEHYIE